MKVGSTDLNFEERMTADSQAKEIADRLSPEEETPSFLSTVVASLENTSTFKANVPGTDEWERRWDKYRRPDVVEDFNPVDYVPKDLLNTGKLDYAWDDIARATTPYEVQDVVTEASVEARRKEIIANGSGWANPDCHRCCR